MEKNQADRSKKGPVIGGGGGGYGKMNEKLESYNTVPFPSRVNRKTPRKTGPI